MVAVEFRRAGILDGIIDPLFQAARARVGEPLCWLAAGRLLAATESRRPIYIATGHVHPTALPVGETDGPPGAASLARALVMATLAPVILLTEPDVVPTVAAACRAAGLTVRDPGFLPMPASVAILPFPIDPQDARAAVARLAPEAAAIVTIEKIGPAADGCYYTGQANNVASSLCKVDLLVDAIREAGAPTIGIGDLGNEIGMGPLRDVVVQHVAKGAKLACTTATEVVIPAGCSNWGAYGIAAAIAGRERNIRLLHDAEIEREMIVQCCRAGGVDGFSTAPSMEVDGAHWHTHAAFVQLLRDVVEISINTEPPERHRFEVMD